MVARRIVVSAGIAAMALMIATSAAADSYTFRLTASDQAAARAVVVHRADLGTAASWKGGLVKPDRSELTCSSYNPKHRDLVVTGIAQSHWTAAGIQINSSAAIFQTDDMVRVDWQRSDSAGLLPCLRTKLRQGLGPTGRLVSLQRIPFSSVSTLTDAFRGLVDVTASGKTVRLMIDTIFVARNRAEIQLSVVAPYLLAAQVQAADARLAILMAGRAPAF